MVRVLFWNVWCLPGIATNGISAKDRAKSIAPLIRGYDLVILNEAWVDEAKDVFKKEYQYSYQTTSKCFKLGDSGILILSNNPLLNTAHLLYSDAAGWDWVSSKGVVYFQIQSGNKTYDFVVTHMQAGHSSDDHKSRLSQIAELTQFVNKKMVRGSNVYLVGDFNVMPIVNGKISGHCHDYVDAKNRDLCYNMITSQTGLQDLQTGQKLLDVYHVFTNQTTTRSTITYHDSKGLSDGPYLTIDI